jgi:hypothetical protein
MILCHNFEAKKAGQRSGKNIGRQGKHRELGTAIHKTSPPQKNIFPTCRKKSLSLSVHLPLKNHFVKKNLLKMAVDR